MTEADTPKGLDPIEQGIHLFNEEYFFEAHEVLEGVWREERGEPRLFLQGLIQLCAGFHHFQNGNLAGAITLLQRGADKMRRYPSTYLGMDAAALIAHVDHDRELLKRMQDNGASTPALEFPRIELKVDATK
jgi:predicted metal-dependent hydrolase